MILTAFILQSLTRSFQLWMNGPWWQWRNYSRITNIWQKFGGFVFSHWLFHTCSLFRIVSKWKHTLFSETKVNVWFCISWRFLAQLEWDVCLLKAPGEMICLPISHENILKPCTGVGVLRDHSWDFISSRRKHWIFKILSKTHQFPSTIKMLQQQQSNDQRTLPT